MYASAEQLTIQPHETYDERTRHHNDTVTWLAEALHGGMRTSFDYHFDGQDLYAEDGGAMGEVFESSISTARQIVELNPNLLFELRRRITEQGEYQDMLAMAKDELPNTMVVISDFPEELMTATESMGGYNTYRKQTMLRVISKHRDGRIRMITQSLDGSNRRALEAIYQELGVELPISGELLEQRIHINRDRPEAWQNQQVDILRDTYDRSLYQQFGGQWHAGIRNTSNEFITNTAEFVSAQKDLIDLFVDAKMAKSPDIEKMLYGLAATVEARLEKSFQPEVIIMKSTIDYQTTDRQYLYVEVEQATQQAIQKGKPYNGCGMTIKMDNSTEGQLQESGYGNKSTPETKYEFNKKMYCVVCQALPKKGEIKKPCGPCGICRNCDKKLGGKG